MAQSTYRLSILHDLMLALHMYLTVDTSSSSDIHRGDLIEMNLSTQLCKLMDDDTVESGYKFVGISNSVWESTMDRSALKKTIEVLGMCICRATVISDTYEIGDLVQYDVGQDDGRLETWFTGNQAIGWVIECETGAVTELQILVNILDPSTGLLEVSS